VKLELHLHNRQRARRLNLRLVRRIVRALVVEHLQIPAVELGITFVSARRMARVNRQFLQHEGSTDVITFDYRQVWPAGSRLARPPAHLHGELLICMDVAVAQAHTFRTSWPVEVVRYLVHGILHLCGYDDRTPSARRLMKREENRLLRRLAGEFPLGALARGRGARQATGTGDGGYLARRR